MIENTSKIFAVVNTQTQELITAVKGAIDEKAWESGQMTADRMTALLEGFKDEVISDVTRKLDDIRTSLPSQEATQVNWDGDRIEGRSTSAGDAGCLYTHGGRMYHVPATFNFPTKVKFKQGLELWLKGQSNSVDNSTFIRPFRNLKPAMLPTKKLKYAYKLSWRALFVIFEGRALSGLPRDTRTLSVADIARYHSLCWEQLKQIVSYCFTPQKQPHTWTISTWATRTRRSCIVKNGNDQDRANLPPESFRNAPNRTTVRVRHQSLLTLYPHRQNCAAVGGDENEEDDGSTTNSISM